LNEKYYLCCRDRRAKVPLACIVEKNFFQKTFGGIIEKVYICTESIINKDVTL
jgi:hypothetical protein